MRPALISLLFASGAASPAFAHAGHLGELAGHSHVLGAAAALGAAALAAWLAKTRGSAGAPEKKDDTGENGEQAECAVEDKEAPAC